MTKKWLRLGLFLTAMGAAGSFLVSTAKGEEGERNLPKVSNATWKTECSGCHMLYHPSLLPERSWTKIMGTLDRHFGENASLDPATREEITRFLVDHSAERQQNRRSQRINQSIPAGETPLRISTTRYFRARHDEVPDAIFQYKSVGSAANCVACHQGADQGDFSESKVRIPR
jgi:cytochrome c553